MGRSRRIPEVEFDLSATTPGPWAIGPGMYTYTGGSSYDDDGVRGSWFWGSYVSSKITGEWHQRTGEVFYAALKKYREAPNAANKDALDRAVEIVRQDGKLDRVSKVYVYTPVVEQEEIALREAEEAKMQEDLDDLFKVD